MKKILITGFAISVGIALFFGLTLFQELRRVASNDPLVWEEIIAELESKTEIQKPSEKAVLFVGSSSIRFWSSLEEDMAPMPVIQHGFGGAKIYDVVYFAEPLITRWKPEKVVIFAGANDINGNDQHHLAPGHIAGQLRILFDIIFSAKADTKVFYIAITPTLYSWDKWESVQEANRLASQVCDDYDNAFFIETADLFLTADGKPNKNLFVFDGLHMNQAGYALWTGRIKPYLLED